MTDRLTDIVSDQSWRFSHACFRYRRDRLHRLGHRPRTVAAGHQVLGLARSEAGASALAAMGAEVHRGALDDLDSLRDGARKADAVIHTAFNHDFSKFAGELRGGPPRHRGDRRGAGRIGRPMLVTSGFGSLAPGRLATEADGPPTGFPRVSEAAAIAVAARGVRASAVRLAPSTHGEAITVSFRA